MSEIFTTANLLAFLSLASLEIVLGIDNIVFISILTGKLPAERRASARRLGLLAAMGMRILLLLSLSVVMRLDSPLFTVIGNDISGRDLILLIGGLFLIAKATWEVHDKLEGPDEHGRALAKVSPSFGSVIAQILAIDVIFSLDSVITAVGMARHIAIMIAAVVVAVIVMMLFAGTVSAFIERHPTLKILALSFMILIGVMLLVEGFGKHIDKGYIYFAMAFSLGVEILNIRVRKKAAPVQLHQSYVEQPKT